MINSILIEPTFAFVWSLDPVTRIVLAIWGIIKALKGIDGVILLHGLSAAGKDTLLNVILGNGFQSVPATNKITNVEVKIDGKKYKIYNVPGSKMSNEEKANLRQDLRKSDKPVVMFCHKPVVMFYLFNATDYGKKLIDVKNIKTHLLALKAEADEYGFKFLAIGTRGDEVRDKKFIIDDLRNDGVCCEILELKWNPKTEIDEIVKSVW